MAITDIHNELLELLERASINNPELVFRLRKTNRLEEGYWLIDFRKILKKVLTL